MSERIEIVYEYGAKLFRYCYDLGDRHFRKQIPAEAFHRQNIDFKECWIEHCREGVKRDFGMPHENFEKGFDKGFDLGLQVGREVGFSEGVQFMTVRQFVELNNN